MQEVRATTFSWNTIPADRVARDTSELELLASLHAPRLGDIGLVRMHRLVQQFIEGEVLTDRRCGSIADIHGNVEGLRRELKFCKDNRVTDLVCTGDLIDRDPNSIQVVQELQAAQKIFKLITLLGNHDLFFMRAMLGSKRDFMTWIGNGGMTVLSEPEVGLEHWGRYATDQAEQMGIPVLKWIRYVLPNNPEMIDRMHKHAMENECLQKVFEWMSGNLFLSHVSEQGLLHVHAGIHTHEDGTHNLHYDSGNKRYSGLWALAKAEEDFFGAVAARLPAHPVYDYLSGQNSPVWIRDWERGAKLSFDQCNRLLDSLGVSGIIVGHTVQDRIENVHEGRLILGDRGLAMAYQNQPAVVLAAPSEGVRCITTTQRMLSHPEEYETRIERARRYAKKVLEQFPG